MAYADLSTVVTATPVAIEWGNQIKDNFEALPHGVLAYAKATANVAGIVGSSTILVQAAAVVLPANRLIKVTGTWRSWSTTVAGDRGKVSIYNGSVVGNEVLLKNPDTSQEHLGGTIVAIYDSGAGGSTTYSTQAVRHSGTGTHTYIASATYPLTIIVEDIGPA